jgi:nucleoside-diphosphate-sugar epimerase
VEEEVRKLSDSSFAPVFLRNATAFGASPRQRFDLVLNNLAAWAHAAGEIRMTSDGTPWRPLVHIEDICSAVLCALEAPREAVAGEAFNVGDNDHNYTVRDIAEIVGAAFPNCRVTFGSASGDTRSYRVCFDKIREHMPQFRCAWSAERGALQLRSVFERIHFDLATLNAPPFTRLEELKHLTRTGQINEALRWTTGAARPESVAA